LRTRSGVPIVNMIPAGTMITKVNAEGRNPQTIVIPIVPIFMHLNHNISPRVHREVRMSRWADSATGRYHAGQVVRTGENHSDHSDLTSSKAQ
jgi:hypothetical protein